MGQVDMIAVYLIGPDGREHALELEGVVEVGRVGGGLVVDDPAVSRRHLVLDCQDSFILVTDLGSSYGTFIDEHRVEQPTRAHSGSTIRFGDTRLIVASGTSPTPTTGSQTLAPQAAVVAPTPTTAVPSVVPTGYEVISGGGIEVRYQAGSAAETVAHGYHKGCVAGRAALAGLGSEPWGNPVVVWLVDPFPDPQSGTFVTAGSLVDASRNELWVVVTPEAPPEAPHHGLARLFGDALPASADLDALLEGYGLHVAGTELPADALADLMLPPLEHAEGDLRSAMALSFVRYLLDREGEPTFRRLLAAPAGQFETTFQELYGATSSAVEEAWHRAATMIAPEVKAGEFLRVAVRYLRPYKLKQLEIFVYMLLSLAFIAAFPFATRRLFDTALPSGEFSEVVSLLVVLGIAFVVSLVAGLRQAYQSAWVSGAVVRDIRTRMFDRLQGLPEAWHARYQQGDVLSRLFNDVGAVEDGLSTAIGTGIFQGLQLVVSAIIMLTINVWLGLLVLLGAPLVAIVYRHMAKGAQERSVDVSEQSSAVLGVAAENNSASAVVRLFGLAGRERDRFGRASDRLFRSEVRMNLFGGVFGLSVNLIVTLLRLLVLGLGAWLIIDGQFTVGGLVAFLAVMADVLSPVTALTTLGQTIQASMGSLVRINEVLDAPVEDEGDEQRPPLRPLEREIRLAGVSFAYTPEQLALNQVECTISAGSRVAFVGPSGSGKSTVLRLLMRMYEPAEGAILLDGNDLRSGTLASLRDQMGVVFQDPFLFDTTLRENIGLGKPGATDEEIMAAAAAAEIDSFVDQLSRGYDTLVGERGANLSGGQRQRVSIARALIRNPRILLLDEATSALDAQTERQINETLERVGDDRTVISITHRLTSITDYDRIFVIDAGRLVEQGSHDELVGREGVYAHLWAEQTGSPIPQAPRFHAQEALVRLPMFRELDPDQLAAVAARLTSFELEPGEVIAEGEGRLLLLARGRASVVVENLSGERVVDAELGVGDAFGLRALLGGRQGAALRANERIEVQMLDDAALHAIATQFPSVAAHLSGSTSASARPTGGQQLSRPSLGLRRSAAMQAVGPVEPPPGPSRADLRRMTGTFSAPTDLQG